MAVEDFAAQIKQGTKESHSAAENTKFVASFLRGVLEYTYLKLHKSKIILCFPPNTSITKTVAKCHENAIVRDK